MHGEREQLLSDNDTDSYGAIARWYDELYGFRDSVDLPFWLAQATRPAMRILELGCGTGRISVGLARAGHDVTALDLSAAMLEVLREKLSLEDASVRSRLRRVQGSMVDFTLAQRFDLVLIPFRGFQHVLTTAEQRTCLACIRNHLADDGRLVFDLFDPNVSKIADYVAAGGKFSQDMEISTEDGGGLRRYTSIVANYAEQVHDVRMRFERIDSAGRVTDNGEDHFGMRWMTHNEALLLLEICGLQVLTTQSGYDGSTLEQRCGELIYTCRRTDGQ